jgi:putative photosynthetic complex assembly protein 2
VGAAGADRGSVATTLSLSMPSVAGVYLGFLGALAIWGWIELAFLTGIVTGPNRCPLAEGLNEWERFIRATGTVAYHEALLLTGFADPDLVLAAPAAENTVAAWTFGVLYVARISAKLNLYFGVPRINTEFIPTPLAHLPSHFRIARMNWVFPAFDRRADACRPGGSGRWAEHLPGRNRRLCAPVTR